MLSRTKLHKHVNKKRFQERDGVRFRVLVGCDLQRTRIDVRRSSAPVIDPMLVDEQLEESLHLQDALS